MEHEKLIYSSINREGTLQFGQVGQHKADTETLGSMPEMLVQENLV